MYRKRTRKDTHGRSCYNLADAASTCSALLTWRRGAGEEEHGGAAKQVTTVAGKGMPLPWSKSPLAPQCLCQEPLVW